MDNPASDVFEQIGSVAASTAGTAVKIPEEIAKTAGRQVAGAPVPDETAPAGGKTADDQKKKAADLAAISAADQKRAAQKIEKIRETLATGNKQIITSLTEKANKEPVKEAGGPQIPQEKKLADELSVSQKQGQGTGELTRGALG